MSQEHASPTPRTRRRSLFRVANVVFLVAPLLFAVAWMWAMWDPSHYLSDVKLAVVNKDKGTTIEKEKLNYGDDVVQGLLDTEYLNVTDSSESDASRGLRDGEYIAVITIPPSFSSDVVSVIDDKPRQAQVTIGYNDHYGTNTPLLTSGLLPGIEHGISQGISQGYGAQILKGLNELGGGLKQAADGAKQVDDGVSLLKDGTEQGRAGAAQLDDGMAQLLDGTYQLGDGAAQIDDGVGQLTGTLIPLLRQVGQNTGQLYPVAATLERLGATEEAAKLYNILAMVDNNNPEALANQLQKLKDGTAQMRYNLNDPSAPYLSGVLQLKDGTRQFREGSIQLDDGVQQLKDGTHELSTKLGEGAQQAPHVADVEASATQIAIPVAYPQDYLHPVQTLEDLENPTSKVLSEGVVLLLVLVFGYLSMALATMVLPYIHRVRRTSHAVTRVLAGLLTLTLANLVLLGLFTLAGSAAGFSPPALLPYAAALVLVAVNGAAVYQMFHVAFGRLIGSIFSVAFFAYGVLCFGGVWPTQLSPYILRYLGVIHPMTYAHDVFVRTVDNNFDSTYVRGVIILMAFTIVFAGISMIVKWRRSTSATAEEPVAHAVQPA